MKIPSRHRVEMWAWLKRHALVLRALLFLGLFIGMKLAWDSLHGGPLEYAVIHNATVRPAATLVNWLTPEVHAHAMNFTLRAPGGGLNILNGCEGIEALFLLCAAFVVAPMERQARILGLVLGIAVVFAINQARILLLFYAYRADPAWFEPLHAVITPIAIVLLVCTYFYSWLYVFAKPRA